MTSLFYFTDTEQSLPASDVEYAGTAMRIGAGWKHRIWHSVRLYSATQQSARHRVHISLPLDCILSQTNLVYTILSYLKKNHFIIMVYPVVRSL
jgi:hypothetical protein